MTKFVGVVVCVHRRDFQTSCRGSGSHEIAEALEQAFDGKDIEVKRIHCFGHCEKGPVVRLHPGGPFYHHVDKDHLGDIIDEVLSSE